MNQQRPSNEELIELLRRTVGRWLMVSSEEHKQTAYLQGIVEALIYAITGYWPDPEEINHYCHALLGNMVPVVTSERKQ